MPFSLDEPDPFPLLVHILATVIRKDIPSVARLHLDELELMQKLVAFTGRSEVDGINYSSLYQQGTDHSDSETQNINGRFQSISGSDRFCDRV